METEEMSDMDRQVETIFEDVTAILNEMVADLNKIIDSMGEIRNRKSRKHTNVEVFNMKKKKYIVISGAPGVGKSTVLKRIKEERPKLLFSRSATDRLPRPEEGPDAYEFISTSQFEADIRDGLFLEYVFAGGVYYGTRKSVLEELSDEDRILLDLDTQGGLCVLGAYPDDTLLVYIYAPKQVVEMRLRQREEHRMPADIIEARLARWEEETKRAFAHYHYQVENADLETCVAQILDIIDNT